MIFNSVYILKKTASLILVFPAEKKWMNRL